MTLYFSVMNLKRAIEIIDGGAWCSLRYITADVKKGSGGKVVELEKCRVARKDLNATAKNWTNHFIANSESTKEGKAANHHLHFTRNMALPNNQIRKAHLILITHLNKEEVI